MFLHDFIVDVAEKTELPLVILCDYFRNELVLGRWTTDFLNSQTFEQLKYLHYTINNNALR